jgi:hypothetical protein
MTMSPASLTAAEVAVGQRLPTLEVNISARTVVMGASSSRDWQPQHHDHDWAVNRAGTKDIFLNTPNQAGWIERYVTDWTGPHGRLGRLRFRMRRSVYPDHVLVFNASVTDVLAGDSGHTWVGLDVDLAVDGETVTECTARVAVPTIGGDNPWALGPDRWDP